jgi:hypothetical protein
VSTPPEGYWESLTPADWKRLLDGWERYGPPKLLHTRIFASGAKETTYMIDGARIGHLELPYHELDTYSLILGRMTIRTFIDEHGELGSERPNSVDIDRAERATESHVEQLARGCGTVPATESPEMLKK